MVSSADVAFGNNHTHITRLKHDHCVNVIIYPQNISDFYILKWKLTRRVHSGRQTAKCRIAECKCESYAAHSADIRSGKRTAFPMVIFWIRIRLIISPDRSFFIHILILQCNHGLIGFRRSGDRTVTCSQSVLGIFRKYVLVLWRFFLKCVCHWLGWNT